MSRYRPDTCTITPAQPVTSGDLANADDVVDAYVGRLPGLDVAHGPRGDGGRFLPLATRTPNLRARAEAAIDARRREEESRDAAVIRVFTDAAYAETAVARSAADCARAERECDDADDTVLRVGLALGMRTRPTARVDRLAAIEARAAEAGAVLAVVTTEAGYYVRDGLAPAAALRALLDERVTQITEATEAAQAAGVAREAATAELAHANAAAATARKERDAARAEADRLRVAWWWPPLVSADAPGVSLAVTSAAVLVAMAVGLALGAGL